MYVPLSCMHTSPSMIHGTPFTDFSSTAAVLYIRRDHIVCFSERKVCSTTRHFFPFFLSPIDLFSRYNKTLKHSQSPHIITGCVPLYVACPRSAFIFCLFLLFIMYLCALSSLLAIRRSVSQLVVGLSVYKSRDRDIIVAVGQCVPRLCLTAERGSRARTAVVVGAIDSYRYPTTNQVPTLLPAIYQSV